MTQKSIQPTADVLRDRAAYFGREGKVEMPDLMEPIDGVRVLGGQMPNKPGELPWVDVVDEQQPDHAVRLVFRDGSVVEIRVGQWRIEDRPVTVRTLRAVRLGVLERRARTFLDAGALRAAVGLGDKEVEQRTAAHLNRKVGRRGRSTTELLGVAYAFTQRAGEVGAAAATAKALGIALPTLYEQLRHARRDPHLLLDDANQLTAKARRQLGLEPVAPAVAPNRLRRLPKKRPEQPRSKSKKS